MCFGGVDDNVVSEKTVHRLPHLRKGSLGGLQGVCGAANAHFMVGTHKVGVRCADACKYPSFATKGYDQARSANGEFGGLNGGVVAILSESGLLQFYKSLNHSPDRFLVDSPCLGSLL